MLIPVAILFAALVVYGLAISDVELVDASRVNEVTSADAHQTDL